MTERDSDQSKLRAKTKKDAQRCEVATFPQLKTTTISKPKFHCNFNRQLLEFNRPSNRQ